MRVQSQRRQTLSVIVSPLIYRRLREEVGEGKISRFVEEAIAKRLDDYEEKLEKEQKEFQQKLISSYKRSARSKALKKEDEI
jgi:hypothetical protein